MPHLSSLALLASLVLAAAPAHANTKVANATSVRPATSEPAATLPAEGPAPADAPATTDAPAETPAETPVTTDVRPRVIVTKPPSALTLMVQYQRVGRAILDLQNQRGTYDCSDLIPRFRAIKLDASLATPAARAVLSVTLDELAAKSERMRGIRIEKACLDNPLAAGCQ